MYTLDTHVYACCYNRIMFCCNTFSICTSKEIWHLLKVYQHLVYKLPVLVLYVQIALVFLG